MAYTLADLERLFPEIPWREPVKMSRLGIEETHWACRICIANDGMHAREIPLLPLDAQVVRDHIRLEHARDGTE